MATIKNSGEKLLVVSEKSNFVGGLEKYVYQSSKILSEAGFQLLGFFAEKKHQLHWEEEDGYTTPFISVCRGYSIAALKKVAISGVKTALIHSCSSPSFVKYLSQNFRTIFFVHDHRYYCTRGQKYFPIINVNCHFPYRRLQCFICGKFSRNKNSYVFMLPFLRESHVIVVLSNYMKVQLIKNDVDEKKIHVLAPYVEINKNISANKRGMPPVFFKSKIVRICFVGQLVRGKGVDMLFMALRNLAKKNYKFTLHLVGEGCQYAELIIMAEQMGILNNTVFYGKQKNPNSIVASSDIVVVPSRWQEPFALVGVEAMLQGKPVIAFKQGGMDEWLEDEKTGYFARAGSVSSLQKKIAYLMENDALREKMGLLGKIMAERKFNKSSFQQNLSAIIKNI